MSDKRIFELYCLRRADKVDPFYPELWQPFYGGKGKVNRKYDHRKEALKLLKNPKAKNTNPIRNYIIHKLWAQGLDFVEDVVLVELTNAEACNHEIEFIATYGRIDLGTGCLSNLTDGGEGSTGHIWSEESKQKIREAKIGIPLSEETKQKMRGPRPNCAGENNRNFGVPHTEEWKQYMSELFSGENNPFHGKTHSEESRKKISENHPDFSGENHPMHGRHHKEESKQKISENHADFSGENHPQYGKPKSEEQKRKQSEAIKGRKDSEETRKKKSESHKGLIRSEEHKKKISESKKGKKRPPFSEEWKRRLSEGKKLLWLKKMENKKESES